MRFSTDLKAIIIQLFKFGLVGVLNTFITLGLIYVTGNVFGAHYVIANITGYAAGFVNSYICNKLWTFKSRGSVKDETIKFCIVTGICYLLQLGFLIILKEGFKVNKDLAQLISMVFYTIINFIGHRSVTFKNKTQDKSEF